MDNFTSDELKVIYNALEFYKYEMNKTDNMDEFRAWKNILNKYSNKISIYRGRYSWKDEQHERV